MSGWFLLLMGLSATIASGQPKASQADFFSPTAKPIPVFTGGVGSVLEGPAFSPDGRLLFTDVPSPTNAGAIWAYNPRSRETTLVRSPNGNADGLLFDAVGNLIALEAANRGGRRLIKTNGKTGISHVLIDTYQGKPFNGPNDATLDKRGNIYFTDARYAGSEPIDQPVMGVYKLAPDGTVQLLAANAAKPNGIAVSPDQKMLYVASLEYPNAHVYGSLPVDFTGPVATPRGDLLAYSLQPDGTVKFSKLLQHFEGKGPDGIKVDVEGNIYAIVANRIMVYSPQGEQLAELPIPVKEGFATNLCFGRGPYSKTLFITATKTLFIVEAKKEGWQIPFEP